MIPLFSNRIRTYAISNNYLGHLEHPDDAHFGATEPTSVEDIGQGSTKPNLNRYADGSAGVAKYDPLSVGFEPFGHHLSAAIGGEKLFPSHCCSWIEIKALFTPTGSTWCIR